MSSDEQRMSTGAPLPPPVWQLICEVAHGSCVCAATRADGPPCHAVEVISGRIRNRILGEVLADSRQRRARS